MPEQDVKIIVSAEDKASGKLKDVGANFEKLAKSAANLGKKMTVVGGALTAMGGLAAREAGEFAALSESYERMTSSIGINSDELIRKLQEASAGSISQKDLVLSANRAMSFGVAKNMDEMVKLLEVARLKARDMGLTTTQAFNDIVTGLGRGSPMILDNLGITVKLGEAQEMYAESLGKTVQELTSAEAKQALVNAVMSTAEKDLAAVGKLNVSAAEKMQMLTAQLADLRVEIGSRLLPHFTKFSERMVEVVRRVTDWMDANPELTQTIIELTVKMAAIMTVVGPLLVALPGLITLVKGLGVAMAFVAANPIVLIIGAIVALGAALYVLIRDWEQTKESLTFIASGLADAVQGVVTDIAGSWGWIKDRTSEKWESITTTVGDAGISIVGHVNGFLDSLYGALEYTLAAYVSIWGTNFDEIAWFTELWVDNMKYMFSANYEYLQKKTGEFTAWMKGEWENFWTLWSGVARLYGEIIKEFIFSDLLQFIGQVFQDSAIALTGVWREMWNLMRTIVLTVGQSILDDLERWANAVIRIVNRGIEAMNRAARSGGFRGNLVPTIPEVTAPDLLGKQIEGPSSTMHGIDALQMRSLSLAPAGHTVNVSIEGNTFGDVRTAEEVADMVGAEIMRSIRFNLKA